VSRRKKKKQQPKQRTPLVDTLEEAVVNVQQAREWLIKAGVFHVNEHAKTKKTPVPLWARMLHVSKAWKLMSYREVRRVAEEEGMQQSVEAAWRLGGKRAVLELVGQSLWEGSR
jgi:hypothetical protein